MSDQISLQVKLALINAQVALQQNNRMEARRWALQAAKLDPNSERAWLILAAISSPGASVVYLQRVLQVNPKSEPAIKGMQWALSRLSNIPDRSVLTGIPNEKESTQPLKIQQVQAETLKPALTPQNTTDIDQNRTSESVIDQLREPIAPPPAIVVQKKTPKKKKRFPWGMAIILFLLIFSTAAVVWAALPGWAALARSSAAPIPDAVLNKPSLTPSLTPTRTATATSTSTPTPTLTPTPLPTNTPEPTNTALPQPTIAPVVDVPQPPLNQSGRWIDINLSQQMLYAYEGDALVGSFLVSTGTSAHPTVTGLYSVYVKYRYTDMSGPGYYLPDVPFTMYFYSGYGIHGTYWHSNFGTRMSHGCVNMRTSDAEWVFNWASVGTPVNVH